MDKILDKIIDKIKALAVWGAMPTREGSAQASGPLKYVCVSAVSGGHEVQEAVARSSLTGEHFGA